MREGDGISNQAQAARDTSVPVYRDLAGRTAVVTGGSRGLGAALCGALGQAAANVVVAGRDAAAIRRTVEDVRRAGGQAIGVAGDATRSGDVAALHHAAIEAFGAVDLLVPFAGGDGPQVPTVETTLEDWDATISSNLSATFLVLREMVPGMQARGRGAVVTMASAAPRRATAASAPYAAAKAGVMALTRQLARECGPDGVRVNCVAPSLIVTEATAASIDLATVADRFPLGRVGAPADVAAATLFLLSDAAAWITGVTIDVAGGRVMTP